jgi:hypothetical protein
MSKLTPAQLEQIVGEVQRISIKQADDLDRSQVQAILSELNLSPDLLDEALVQLQRREALAAERKRFILIASGIAATAIVACGGFWLLSQQQQGAIDKLVAQRDIITKSAFLMNEGARITNVDRQNNTELFYHVTLKDAPVGQTLSPSCDWIDPNNKIVKQNKFKTKEISTSIWDTHCKYQIGSGATVGKWQVKMSIGGKVIGDESFTVDR